jgi:hypothetical protein
MFAKLPFTYFEITFIQIHFVKTTLGFSVITKNSEFTCTLNFKKFHTNIHKLYTHKHILHTNKYMSSITSTRTVTIYIYY